MDDSEKSFWFVVYPFQCIIVAEEVMWTTDMTKACDEDDYLDAIKDIRYCFVILTFL